jgi:hypothetical protein
MKDKLISLKNHLSAHRAAYATGAACIAGTAIVVKVGNEWLEFAQENGVINEFTQN